MNSAKRKRVILAVTGGIAAYKSPEIVRRLKDHDFEVRVVMTSGAHAFITPLTMQAVSGLPVHDDLLDPQAEAGMGHIELAKWADLILIAPASASVMAKVAQGHADNLLGTLCLATDAAIAFAPAMNQQMWAALPTRRNARQLEADGRLLWGPGEGSQACGDVGAGRMLEPDDIVQRVIAHFTVRQVGDLQGRKVVVTAGPTREALDPVRFISNHSSGKMGFELAKAAAASGAQVTLIAGPVNLATPANVKRIDVLSALDMQAAVKAAVEAQSIFISCAAVADYRAAEVAEQKTKKQGADDDEIELKLIKNPDILANVAKLEGVFTCGFAAETENLTEYAKSKLERKKIDMIAANDVSQPGLGFDSDMNHIHLFWREPNSMGHADLGVGTKQGLASEIIKFICEQLKQRDK